LLLGAWNAVGGDKLRHAFGKTGNPAKERGITKIPRLLQPSTCHPKPTGISFSSVEPAVNF